MLNGDDIAVKSAEMLPSSFCDALKHTMMSQDLVFRTQVYELHRLYGVQKNLMSDFEKASIREIHLLTQNPDSTTILAASRNNINCISASGTSSATSVGDFAKDQTQKSIHKMQSGFQQKLFGFQLPADEFISSGADHPLAERKEYMRKSHNAHVNTELSFNFISNRRNHVGDKRKACSFPDDDVIDLEIPNVCWSNSNRDDPSSFRCIAPIHSCDGDRDKVERCHQSLPWFLRTVEGDLNHGPQDNMHYEITGSRLPMLLSPSCQKQTQKVSDFSPEVQLEGSGGVLDLDLNVAQLDSLSNSPANSDAVELSRISNESATAGSRKVINNCLADSSPVSLLRDGANEGYIQEKTYCMTYSGGVTGRGSVVLDIDLERMPESPSDAGMKICSAVHDLRNESVGSSSRDPDLHKSHGIDVSRAEHESSKRALKQLCKKKSSVSNESEITDDNHSGAECGVLNPSSSIEIGKGQPQPLIENVCSEQDQRSSESTTVSNNQIHIDEEERADEVYEWVQGAAAALVGLSLDCRVFDRSVLENTSTATLQNEGEDDIPDEIPKVPIPMDSYEEMVLGIEESAPEDLTAVSMKFDVSEPGKECGYKLKRGTRMKDFQKDILPSLSSLARREICEDINTMDGVIRSREYKKMRLKMGDSGNDDSCMPLRRRRGRGRVNYSRRYCG